MLPGCASAGIRAKAPRTSRDTTSASSSRRDRRAGTHPADGAVPGVTGATTQARVSRAAVSQAAHRAGSCSSGQSGSSAATAWSQKRPTSSAGPGGGPSPDGAFRWAGMPGRLAGGGAAPAAGAGSRSLQHPVSTALTRGLARAVRSVQVAAAATRPAASRLAPAAGEPWDSARATPAR